MRYSFPAFAIFCKSATLCCLLSPSLYKEFVVNSAPIFRPFFYSFRVFGQSPHIVKIFPPYKQWSLSTATAPQPPRHSTLRPVAATQKNCYITLPLTISQRPVTAIRSCPLADKYPFIPRHTRRNAQASFLNEGTFSLTHLAQK